MIEAQLLNGVALGSILALVALGLTIIFGLLGFVNFAHGGLFTVGAYAGWLAYTRYDSYVLGIVAAVAVTFVAGIVIERLLIRLYYRRPKEDQILVTFGLGIVLVEIGSRALYRPEQARADAVMGEQRRAAGGSRAIRNTGSTSSASWP